MPGRDKIAALWANLSVLWPFIRLRGDRPQQKVKRGTRIAPVPLNRYPDCSTAWSRPPSRAVL